MTVHRAFLSFAFAVAASTASAAVSGRVISSDGKPVAGATVTAYAQETVETRAQRIVQRLAEAGAPVEVSRTCVENVVDFLTCLRSPSLTSISRLVWRGLPPRGPWPRSAGSCHCAPR